MAQDSTRFNWLIVCLALLGLSLAVVQPLYASVGLTRFFTTPNADSITIVWETETELENSGYNLWRTTENVALFEDIEDRTRINSAPIAPIGTQGGRYEQVDSSVELNTTYYYWLQDIDTNGVSTYNGPASGRIERGTEIGGGQDDPPTRTPTNTPTLAAGATRAPSSTPTPDEDESPARSTATPTRVATSAANDATDAATTQSSEPTETARVFITVTSPPSADPTDMPTDAAVAVTVAPTITPSNTPAVEDEAVSAEPTQLPLSTSTPRPTPATVGGGSEQDDSSAVIISDEPEAADALVEQGEQSEEVVELASVSETPVAAEGEVVVESAVVVEGSDETNAAVGGASQIGGGVTDVNQVAVQQTEPDSSNTFLWLGVAAGGLLLLVSAGFALLFLGSRSE